MKNQKIKNLKKIVKQKSVKINRKNNDKSYQKA